MKELRNASDGVPPLPAAHESRADFCKTFLAKSKALTAGKRSLLAAAAAQEAAAAGSSREAAAASSSSSSAAAAAAATSFPSGGLFGALAQGVHAATSVMTALVVAPVADAAGTGGGKGTKRRAERDAQRRQVKRTARARRPRSCKHCGHLKVGAYRKLHLDFRRSDTKKCRVPESDIVEVADRSRVQQAEFEAWSAAAGEES